MLTPKKPSRSSIGHVDDARLMLTIRLGGSSDSEETEVTVMPVISSARPAVITLTPPARWRIAPRRSSAGVSGLSSMTRSSVMGSSTFMDAVGSAPASFGGLALGGLTLSDQLAGQGN